MKKLLLIYLFILTVKVAGAIDYFEINSTSNSIVGSLWRELEVPQDKINDFFRVIEKNFKPTEDEKSDKTRLINEWKKTMINYLNLTYSTNGISGIEKFAAQVDSLKDNFSATTIENGLSIITGKY